MTLLLIQLLSLKNLRHHYLPQQSGQLLQEILGLIQKISKEIEDRKGFLNSVLKKLNNPRFVSNAPEKVVQLENKKKIDAGNQIKVLEDKLSGLSK